MRKFNLFIVNFILFFVVTLSGEGNLIEVGVSKIDITPLKPIRLAGYAVRKEESQGVGQKIWAKAMAIGGESNPPCLLISAEICAIPKEVYVDLVEKLSRRTDLDQARIAVSITHNHYGPELSGKGLSSDQRTAVKQYRESLSKKLITVALNALKNRRPCNLSWGKGKVDFAVNRRIVINGRWVGNGENIDGPVDHDLPVLKVTDEQNRLVAVLAGYACHNTTIPGTFNKVHGDWAGVAQEIIESRSPGAIAMITIGCAGDQKPMPRGFPEEYKKGKPALLGQTIGLEDNREAIKAALKFVQEHGRSIAEEVEKLLNSSLTPITEPPVSRFKRINLPFQSLPTRDELEKMATVEGAVGNFATLLLKELNQGKELPSELSYPVQIWTFGNDLAMIFLGGEVLVDYSIRLKKELDTNRIWLSAYTNNIRAYIPSARVIREGGYEVDISRYYNGLHSRFSLGIEDMIVSTVHELLPSDFKSIYK